MNIYQLKKAKFDIFLTLANEHYELNRQHMWDVWGIPRDEKIPLVFKYSKKDPSKVLISPKVPGMPDKWDIENFKKEKKYYAESKFCFIQCEKDKTMKQTYIDFITKADILKEATNGRINLYKTGGNLKKWSLELFRQMNLNIQPEQIQPDEHEFIESAKCGSLVWAKNGYKGKAYKKDMVSMYPYILKNQKFMIPIKRGEFKKITKKEFDKMDYYNFGIYRVKITGSDYRIFRYNKRNYYTHYDLAVAKKRSYKMELIEDDKPNFLFYGKDCRINGDVMFNQFVDYLFPLKKKQIDGAKDILNTIWGAMCEKNRMKLFADNNKLCEIGSDKIVEKTIPLNLEKEQYLIHAVKRKKIYLSDFARIGPFILSCGRKLIGDIIYPQLDNVVRLNTDRFLTLKREKINFNRKIMAIIGN